jgi:hypothetical protein
MCVVMYVVIYVVTLVVMCLGMCVCVCRIQGGRHFFKVGMLADAEINLKN